MLNSEISILKYLSVKFKCYICGLNIKLKVLRDS